MLLILLFIHSTFFKEKSGIFGGFCWFVLSGLFYEHPGVFFGWVQVH